MRTVRLLLAAAALLAASLVPSAASAWGAKKGEEPKLRAEVVDVVDGLTAVEAFFETQGAGAPARAAVRAGEGLHWKIEAGRAEILEDAASGQRVLRYRGAEYWSYHPSVGPIRMRYQTGKTSQVVFTSLDPTGQSFFPAQADGEFYLAMEMVDLGMTIVNPQPMRLHTDSTGWPPFQVPMLAVQPTDFVDAMQPNLIMMQVLQQELYLYPTSELEITTLGQTLAGNQLTAAFSIQNLTESPATVRWFAIGDVGTPAGPGNGLVNLGPGQSANVILQTTVAASSQTQYITLGAVSQCGPRLAGAERISFSYLGTSTAQKEARKPGRSAGEARAKGRG